MKQKIWIGGIDLKREVIGFLVAYGGGGDQMDAIVSL